MYVFSPVKKTLHMLNLQQVFFLIKKVMRGLKWAVIQVRSHFKVRNAIHYMLIDILWIYTVHTVLWVILAKKSLNVSCAINHLHIRVLMSLMWEPTQRKHLCKPPVYFVNFANIWGSYGWIRRPRNEIYY